MPRTSKRVLCKQADFDEALRITSQMIRDEHMCFFVGVAGASGDFWIDDQAVERYVKDGKLDGSEYRRIVHREIAPLLWAALAEPPAEVVARIVCRTDEPSKREAQAVAKRLALVSRELVSEDLERYYHVKTTGVLPALVSVDTVSARVGDVPSAGAERAPDQAVISLAYIEPVASRGRPSSLALLFGQQGTRATFACHRIELGYLIGVLEKALAELQGEERTTDEHE